MRSPETNSQKTISVSKRHLGLLFTFVILLVAALVYLLINQSNNTSEDNDLIGLQTYKAPLGNLPTYRGSKMVKAYYDQFTPKPGSGQPQSVTDQPEIVRSVYFEFAPLYKYIRKMRHQYQASGVRIYFAKYDSTEMRVIQKYPNKPDTSMKDLKGYCTVVIVPTRKDKQGNIIDDLVTRNKNGTESLLHFLDQPVPLFQLGTEILTQAQNGGISCPPYPPYVCQNQLLLNYAKDSLSFLNYQFNWTDDNQ